MDPGAWIPDAGRVQYPLYDGGGRGVATGTPVSPSQSPRAGSTPPTISRGCPPGCPPGVSPVMLSDTATGFLYPNRDPVGRPMIYDFEVLGIARRYSPVIAVVSDVKHRGLDAPRAGAIYIPWRRAPTGVAHLVVRTTGDPAALVPGVRDLIRTLNPSLPVPKVRTLADHVAGSIAERTVAPSTRPDPRIRSCPVTARGSHAELSLSRYQRSSARRSRFTWTPSPVRTTNTWPSSGSTRPASSTTRSPSRIAGAIESSTCGLAASGRLSSLYLVELLQGRRVHGAATRRESTACVVRRPPATHASSGSMSRRGDDDTPTHVRTRPRGATRADQDPAARKHSRQCAKPARRMRSIVVAPSGTRPAASALASGKI